MCGLVTIACFDGKPVRGALLRRLTDVLAHRGPDDHGYACVDPATGRHRRWGDDLPEQEELRGILFGHRRLSILDLSRAGHQPMVSDDGSLVLSYNGEIYNFLELREELKSLGATFRSQTDTEVLLKAYECWGTRALSKFNGMWAFTLWDGRRRVLVASRDRFGVKPLYYTVVDGTWIFASEIKAIVAYPGAFRGFHEANVTEYLVHGATDHLKDTLYRDIRSVAAAGLMEVDPGGAVTREQRFWRLEAKVDASPGREVHRIQEFRALLNDSVRLRVRSDVPVGTMLSGGLDSTSISALIHRQRSESEGRPGEPAGEGLRNSHQAFTACWPGWVGDEEAAVERLCARYGMNSFKGYPTPEEVWDLLPTVTYYLDEPFEFPISVVQYRLMQSAREHGVKVVLNGHGADEILCGYPARFVPVLLASRLLNVQPWDFARDLWGFRGTSGWRMRQVVGTYFASLGRRLRDGEGGESSWRRLLRSVSETADSAELSLVGESCWTSFSEEILPQWLRMEDRVSMAVSVESRLPFMDYRLVEFSFRLPDSLKLRNGHTKYVLRQAMKDLLPRDLAIQRTKRFFGVPYQGWLRGPWKPHVMDLFTGSCAITPFVDLSSFRKYLADSLGDPASRFDASFVYRAVSTEIWLRGVARSLGRTSC